MDVIGSVTGRLYRTGPLLARAGEGAVYRVEGDASILIKIFDDPPGARAVQKLELLARYSPKPAFTALPIETVLDAGSGAVLGFVQTFFAKAVPLGQALDSVGRKKIGVPDGLQHRVKLCRLLGEALERLHAVNLVMGDVSDSNFLILRDWLGRPKVVAVIDCNSLQVTLRTNRGNECFVSGVATEAFGAPEVQLTDWSMSRRTIFSDSFGLAVACWLVLFNASHPFAVATPGNVDVPALGERIACRLFPYAPASPLPPGWTQLTLDPSLGILPAEVREMFYRTFSAADPRDRPTAAEWVRAFRQWELKPTPRLDARIRVGAPLSIGSLLPEMFSSLRGWVVRGLVLACIVLLTIFFPSLQRASFSPSTDPEGLRPTTPVSPPSTPLQQTKPTRTRYVDPGLFPGPDKNSPSRTKE